MPTLDELARFLDEALLVEAHGDDVERLWRPRAGPVRRLGLALEAGPELDERAEAARLDALLLHRPWAFDPGPATARLGVLAAHRAFDERLTLGRNPRLAAVLGLADPAALGEKEGRPIGMLGAVAPTTAGAFAERLGEAFGGLDELRGEATRPVARVAVVGALTDALVREAATRGADLYVSGQWRAAAAEAVEELGLAVAVVGHRRSEAWGLRALAGLLRERWAALEVVVLEPAGPERTPPWGADPQLGVVDSPGHHGAVQGPQPRTRCDDSRRPTIKRP